MGSDINDASISRRLWGLSTVAAMGVFLDGYDLNVIAFSVLLISSFYHIPKSSVTYSLLLASSLIGMAIGGALFGWLADRLGRRSMFIVDLVFFVLFGALSAIATSPSLIIAFRVLMGIGIGADYPISSSLIAEFSPRRSRGFLLMYGVMFYWLGVLASGLANLLALSLGPALSWRAALGAGAAIAVPVILLRSLVPESARWLYSKGQAERAEESVKSVWGSSIKVPEQPRGRSLDLLKKSLPLLLLVAVTWFAFDVGSYGFGFYTPTLYYELGITNLREIILFGMATAPFPIVAYLVLMWIVDRAGRRVTSTVGFAAMLAVLLVLPFAVKVTPYALFPLFVLFSSLEQWPGGILSFAYSVELFPTPIRALAQGISTSVSRIGAIFGIVVFGMLQSKGLVYGTAFFAAFIALALVLTIVKAPETKGLALESIAGKAGNA